MMDDPKTDWKLMKVCPDVALRWRAARQAMWDQVGKQIRVTDGFRDFAEQWEVWSKGRFKNHQGNWEIRNKKLVVTYAMPGQSLHQYGLAIDSCFMGEDPYLEKLPKSESAILWQLYGKSLHAQGLDWGGYWKIPDRPHCQLMYGLSLHTIQMIYEEHGLGAVWEKCKNALMCGGPLV